MQLSAISQNNFSYPSLLSSNFQTMSQRPQLGACTSLCPIFIDLHPYFFNAFMHQHQSGCTSLMHSLKCGNGLHAAESYLNNEIYLRGVSTNTNTLYLTYSRANFICDKTGTKLCACQWIFNRCERSRTMQQNIGIYTFTSFPMPFFCAFRDNLVSSLWEPSQKILTVTLRWDPPLTAGKRWLSLTENTRARSHKRRHGV